VEVTVQSLRVARQSQLSHTDYEDAMMAEMDDLGSSFKLHYSSKAKSY
jgi:hypothetical protein